MSIHPNVPDDFSEIHLIPYMHTDFSWTNSRHWHIWRYIYGFKRALDMMREDPAYTYVIDNVHHAYMLFERYCPELIEEFGMRVCEGRMVIANGGYALARPNYSGDEVYVRNLVEGRRYFEARFEIPAEESRFFFNADTAIGHSQLPQILTLTQNRYYRANRPAETMNRKGIPRQFLWRGLDQSEVIVARGEYGGLFLTDFFDQYPDMEGDWDKILAAYWAWEEKNACNAESDKLMMFFGCDDVIPGCNLVDRPVPYHAFMDTWNRHQKGRMFLSTPGRYFATLEAERDKLPIVDGVLDHCELSYNVPHKGERSMWYRRRMLERAILRLESMQTMAEAYGVETRPEDVKALWLDLMGISGHALEYVLVGDIEGLERLGDEAILRAARLTEALESEIAERIETHADADKRVTEYTVFNPLPDEREELVSLHIASPHGLTGLTLTDANGEVLPYQSTHVFVGDKGYPCDCNSAEVLTKVKLPAMGWTTVTASPGETPIVYEPSERPLGQDTAPVVVDTGAVTVTFVCGKIVRVEQGCRVVDGGIGDLSFAEFRPKSVGWAPIWGDAEEFLLEPRAWGIVQSGPLCTVYRTKGRLRTSDVTVDVTMKHGSARMDFDVTFDCEPNEGIFTVSFPCDADTDLYADVPFGVEHRDLTCEPSAECQAIIADPSHYFFWESAWRGQFFARNFALFRKNDMDTAILSDTASMYYSLRRDRGTVSLLLLSQLDLSEKSEAPSDSWVTRLSPAFCGTGRSRFAFAYCPFEPADRCELFHRAAQETKRLHVRPSAVPRFGFLSKGNLPAAASVLSHTGAPVVITADYAEGEDCVIRGYESAGVGGRVTLSTFAPVTRAAKTDLLGNPLGHAVSVSGACVTFDTRPWEIFTIRLQHYRKDIPES